jgi:hypothetical protein
MAPQGSYHTSATLSDAFFTKEERDHRNTALINRMPFLYRLLCAKIQGNMPGEHVGSVAPQDPVQDDSYDEHESDPSDELVDYDGSVLKTSKDPATRRVIRVQTVRSCPKFCEPKLTVWLERTGGPHHMCHGGFLWEPLTQRFSVKQCTTLFGGRGH